MNFKAINKIHRIIKDLKRTAPEVANLGREVQELLYEFNIIQPKKNPYQILGCYEDDPDELIREIFRIKAKYYHPDKGGSEEKMRKLLDAYEEIKRCRKWTT
ncbi:MAG TPA: J domain-containing protein [Candidatus Desulfofervidus auxilii]|uniref:J domain-containing protein n=1 Tax=Desulfofervidus auxilii TaxID=1621989 RepID=A0A7C0Y3Q8_DESA2|nr:J domain-containing protein [Candidatus Desulfofervidus auxilii]